MTYHSRTMEPEYFLKPEEFHQLLKTTETSRDRLILLLLGGAGLRVGEMTQVRVEDFDLDAGCLHQIRSRQRRKGTRPFYQSQSSPSLHYLADNAIDRGYSFPGRTSGHISSRRVQIALNALAERANLQITKYVDKGGRNRHRITLTFCGTALRPGAWRAAYPSTTSRSSSATLPLWRRQSTCRIRPANSGRAIYNPDLPASSCLLETKSLRRDDKMADEGLSRRISEIYQQIEDLQMRCVSDPGNATDVLSDALEELEACLEELSTADEELCQQNEELIEAQEALHKSEVNTHHRDNTYDWELA
jgi:hypothetical protein